VQRAILAAFAADPDNALLLSELCERVYPGRNRIEKKHRNAVARAAKAIPSIRYMKREVLGSELVFYDPLNVMSYAMAELKSDAFIDYRNNDPRTDLWQQRKTMCAGYNGGAITEEEMRAYVTTSEIPAKLKALAPLFPHLHLDVVAHNELTEQDLRKMLAPDGDHHKYVVEGGAWWRRTEIRKAHARGDGATVARLQAEEDEEEKKEWDKAEEEAVAQSQAKWGNLF
jgi:hypothetical protein